MGIGPKKILGVLIGLVSLFAVAATASAAPDLSGPTGMIRTPTADVLRTGQLAAGYFYRQDYSTAVVGAGLPLGWELSAAFGRQGAAADKAIFNLKYSLKQEALLVPAIAVGIEDIGGAGKRSVYGALSKELPLGFRLHLGVGTGRFDGMFGAIEKVLNPTPIRKRRSGFPVTSVILEMDGSANFNIGLKMRLARGVRLSGGWLGREHQAYLGLTYTR